MDWNGVQNYVVVGGDFNHDLVVDNPLYDINTIPWWDNYEIDGTKASWYNYFRLGGNLSADGEKILLSKIILKHLLVLIFRLVEMHQYLTEI